MSRSLALAVVFCGACTQASGGAVAQLGEESPQSAAAPAGADPLQTDPDKYSLVMENERVRVLRYHDRPGQQTHRHSHPDAVLHAMGGFQRRLTFADGRSVDRTFAAGDVSWIPAQSHLGENIGTTDTDVLLVELK